MEPALAQETQDEPETTEAGSEGSLNRGSQMTKGTPLATTWIFNIRQLSLRLKPLNATGKKKKKRGGQSLRS